ncbi:MAG: CcmD family protein [Chloroflexota bacterium]|nr:CcmD family protein [Chloroflexota bacterium]
MTFLAAGMIVFWLTTFVFVFSTFRRQQKLEAELTTLQQVYGEDA